MDGIFKIYLITVYIFLKKITKGCPMKGEIIPIRLYLSGYELTPTYKNISNKFSVKYFLNLILVDDDERRYFK